MIPLEASAWLPLLPDCADTTALPGANAPWLLVEIYDETGQYKETAEVRFDVVVTDDFAPELNWMLYPKNDLSSVLDPAYESTYFQGITQVLAQTDVRCWEGATVAKVTMEVEGKTYCGTTENLVSYALTSVGEVAVTLTATDSRGLSISYEDFVTVTPYARPVVVLGEKGVFRCDASGNADTGGNYLYVHAGASVFPLSGENTGGILCRVTPVGLTPGDFPQTVLEAEGVVEGAQLLPEYNYLVELLPFDGVCQGNILPLTIPKQTVYAHQKDASLALGMYCDKGGLEVAWPARFYDTLSLGSATLTEESLQKLLDLIM